MGGKALLALPKLNIAELFFNTQGIPDWFITHKLPVFNREGLVIGVMGLGYVGLPLCHTFHKVGSGTPPESRKTSRTAAP